MKCLTKKVFDNNEGTKNAPTSHNDHTHVFTKLLDGDVKTVKQMEHIFNSWQCKKLRGN